jgi:membrane protease YdiL (CAAX protease family)
VRKNPITLAVLLVLLWIALWLASPRPIPIGPFLLAATILGSLVALGLAAARRLDRGAPMLDGEVPAPLAARRLGLALAIGAVAGAVVLAVLVYGLIPFEPALATRLHARAGAPPWLPWALAFEASILEELLLRLFLLSSLAWALARGWRSRAVSPPAAWIAIALSALAFGAIHLPSWLAVTSPTAMLVSSVLALNFAAGMVLGWVYWRWGIESAVVAHFAADMVVQGLGPTLVG